MKQRGFTLIEIIVVIVILGILAAVALPKFIDLTSEALDASVQGVAGAISSASSVNYGAYIASNGSKGTAVTGSPCTSGTLGGLLTGGWPTQGGVTYTVAGGACSGGSGGTTSCVITGTKGTTAKSATAQVVCTG